MSEGGELFGERFEIHARLGPVHGLELRFVRAVERGHDQVGPVQIGPQGFVAEGHGVGEQTELEILVMILDVPDYFADAGVEQGLSRAGKGDVVDLGLRGEDVVQFADDGVGGNVVPAFAGVVRGFPRLAIDAVQLAGLGRDQGNAQRSAQSPGVQRTENVTSVHLCMLFLDFELKTVGSLSASGVFLP